MNDRKSLGIGLGGSVLAVACCFTPIPALLLGAIGLSGWLVWLDYVFIPALVLSLGIAAYALMRRYTDAEVQGMTELESTITCPQCGHTETETMPTNACRFFYDCKGCGVLLQPKPGDCCVFCSYGSVPCPPVQRQAADRP